MRPFNPCLPGWAAPVVASFARCPLCSWHTEACGASLTFPLCPCAPAEGPTWAFQGSESPSAAPALMCLQDQGGPATAPGRHGTHQGPLSPGSYSSLENGQSTSARLVGLGWRGEGNRTRTPQRGLASSYQWGSPPIGTYSFLAPHHIPVTVQGVGLGTRPCVK